MESLKPGKGARNQGAPIIHYPKGVQRFGRQTGQNHGFNQSSGAKGMMASTTHINGELSKTVVLEALLACGFYL